jgi:hypothetical protein
MQTELLDAFDEKEATVLFPADSLADERLGFRNATFSWSKDSETDGSDTRSKQFKLKIDGEVIFERGRINLVIGPTGSGTFFILVCIVVLILLQARPRCSWRFLVWRILCIPRVADPVSRRDALDPRFT